MTDILKTYNNITAKYVDKNDGVIADDIFVLTKLKYLENK